MQHIKLTIPGEFWDSQIYARTLYLFGDSGDLFTINWDNYIEGYFDRLEDLRTVAHVSFLESDLFYTRSSQTIFKDNSIKRQILDRFSQLARLNIEMGLNGKDVTHSDNPLPFPHADSEVYYSKLYVALNSGVFTAPCNLGYKGKENTRIWDAPVLGMSASSSYTSIALAAGSEGLYEIEPHIGKDISKARQVSPEHCSSCEWSDFNITASSHARSAFFAAYRKVKDEKHKGKFLRILDKIIPLDSIFSAPGTLGVLTTNYICTKIDQLSRLDMRLTAMARQDSPILPQCQSTTGKEKLCRHAPHPSAR